MAAGVVRAGPSPGQAEQERKQAKQAERYSAWIAVRKRINNH